MLSRKEYLLTCLAEECMEVSQRITKALRFGLDEVQPEQELTNQTRIRLEFLDVLTTVERLRAEGVELYNRNSNADIRHMREKADKLERFYAYSRGLGKVE